MYCFIAKPPQKKQTGLYEEIKRTMKERGLPYEFFVTTRKGEAKELSTRCSAEKGNVVVAVGGDGMLNEVLEGLCPENAALGLIPAGTGNDFAKSAKIPEGIAALSLLLERDPLPTDYLSFPEGRRSLNIAGIGIDVDILRRCEKMKRLHSKSKYFLSLLHSLITYRGTEMKICADGEIFEGKMLLAAVCNGTQFGGGIPICPPAKIDDGSADLVLVEIPSRLKILPALVKLMHGKVLSLPFARHLRCKRVSFSQNVPFFAQYDGELYETRQFEATLETGLFMFRGEE